MGQSLWGVTVQDVERMKEGLCPDCDEFLEYGPRGGLSQNLICPKGHRFNVSPIFVERITEKENNHAR